MSQSEIKADTSVLSVSELKKHSKTRKYDLLNHVFNTKETNPKLLLSKLNKLIRLSNSLRKVYGIVEKVTIPLAISSSTCPTSST